MPGRGWDRGWGWGWGGTQGPLATPLAAHELRRRAQPSLTVQDPAGGWNVLFQSKQPLSETHPLFPPPQKPPATPVARPVSFYPQGRAGLQLPYHQRSELLHLSRCASILIFCSCLRGGIAGPRSWPRSSFPLTFSPSLLCVLFCVPHPTPKKMFSMSPEPVSRYEDRSRPKIANK